MGMKTTNWTSFAFYGILLLLLAMISLSQSRPHERYERFERNERHEQHERHPLIIQNDAIFDAPKVAKEICPDGLMWSEGKCRFFVD